MLTNYKFLTNVLFIAIPAMLLSVAVMAPLIDVPIFYLFVDGAVSGVILAGLCLVLGAIVRFNGMTSMSAVQRYINYAALGLLFVICWVGTGVLFIFVALPGGMIGLFAPIIPLRVVMAVLVYALVMIINEYSVYLSRSAPENNASQSAEEELAAGSETPPAETIEHIAVKNGQKIDLIFIQDIISIQAEGDYVMIYTPKGRFIKEQTMKYFADNLPRNKFVRIHRSGIVNIDFISSIESYEKQRQIVKLLNNIEVKASEAGYKELKKALNL